MKFEYCGEVPASKSLLNRWLLLAEYASGLQIQGDSSADDVKFMREGLQQLQHGAPIDCGSAGTAFRFLSLRASRVPGRHVLYGTPRLMARPHHELDLLLKQLGVQLSWGKDRIEIEGSGWQLRPGQQLKLDPAQTSQFASAVLLNAWGLEEDLHISWGEEFVSEAYFKLTLRVVERAGMQIEIQKNSLTVPKHQKTKIKHVQVEADLSSTFALAAIAAVAGQAEFMNFPFDSFQPDREFLEILERMQARLEYSPTSVKVHRSPRLKALEIKLTDCPDLFPVLAVLCSCAEGQSKLFGAPHLIHKESNRLHKTAELLGLMDVVHKIFPDGIVVEGKSLESRKASRGLSIVRSYNPDQDHRLAMAAQLANWIGVRIEILHPEVATKSFPGFWDLTGVGV